MDPDTPDIDNSGIGIDGGGGSASSDGVAGPDTLTVDGAASALEAAADDGGGGMDGRDRETAPAHPSAPTVPAPTVPAGKPSAAQPPQDAGPPAVQPGMPTPDQIERYRRDLDMAAAVLAQQLGPEPDWQKEFDADPIEAGRKFALYQTRQRQLEQVERERVAVGQAVQAQAEQSLRTHLARESQRLTDLIPEWKDGSRAREDKAAIVTSLQSHGYSPQEINQLYDSRAVVLARKAMLYDRLTASRPEVEKRVADAPPFQRPGAAGPGGGRTTALARLARSGSVDDAAALIALG